MNLDQNFAEIASLQFWSIYGLKIVATTSEGIGTESAIIKIRIGVDGK